MDKDSTEPIIRTWELRNFQSIRETETLDLKPLTIFSGPNSSGKSAVIKSLLMVAQSLGSPAREIPLVLNGKYTQLGDFDHILHHGSNPPEMELRFVIRGQEKGIDVWVLIEKNESPTSMRVTDSTVSWGDSDEESFDLRHNSNKFKQLRNAKEQEASQIVQEQIKHGLFDYEIIKPEGIESHPRYENTVSASLSNFLPGRTLIRVKSEIRKITEDINQAREAILSIVDDNMPSIPVDLQRQFTLLAQQRFFREIRRRLHYRYSPADSRYEEDLRYLETIDTILNVRTSLTIDNLKQIIDAYDLAEHQVEDLARRMSGTLPWLQRLLNNPDIFPSFQKTKLEDREFPSQYSLITQQIRRVFGNQIFYLGPLRDDPKTIYAIPPLPNQQDVGLKGEYTAAMLDVHKDLFVDYPLPPPLEGFNGEYQFDEAKLSKAVQVWLERMGLAESFDTTMTSKVGYQLTVRPTGVKQDLDLMSLGVGVSQVLPTIVMALLAPKDSVLIFEQPEVHLHPKVQSVLGDFFLGIVGCGKQCIVETHSEHLINRIRRRIAESRDEKILQALGIYFVELKDGISQFSLVKPNEYGAILDWPNDFFDETGKESEEIIIAALAKQNETIGEPKKPRRQKRPRT